MPIISVHWQHHLPHTLAPLCRALDRRREPNWTGYVHARTKRHSQALDWDLGESTLTCSHDGAGQTLELIDASLLQPQVHCSALR